MQPTNSPCPNSGRDQDAVGVQFGEQQGGRRAGGFAADDLEPILGAQPLHVGLGRHVADEVADLLFVDDAVAEGDGEQRLLADRLEHADDDDFGTRHRRGDRGDLARGAGNGALAGAGGVQVEQGLRRSARACACAPVLRSDRRVGSPARRRRFRSRSRRSAEQPGPSARPTDDELPGESTAASAVGSTALLPSSACEARGSHRVQERTCRYLHRLRPRQGLALETFWFCDHGRAASATAS